ncbi:hypothetical protein BH10BAC4_BH10BAC4_15450 [soil metagenome]
MVIQDLGGLLVAVIVLPLVFLVVGIVIIFGLMDESVEYLKDKLAG